ncbi:MAG: NYN domain-containing protein [Candidatus Fimimonas sp.]
MLRNRKIAVFIDVDNTEMDFAEYQNAMQQVGAMGEIVCATVYGASERKQKGVIDDAKQKGYAIQLPSRTRRRVRKVFDDRIWVDVTDLVAHNANVDTVAVVAIPTDMVYLFSYLRRLGLCVIGVDGLDQASSALLSDVVTLQKASAPKKPKATNPKSKAQPNQEQRQTDETAELLREIDRLRDNLEPAYETEASATAQPQTNKPEEQLAERDEGASTAELIGKIEEMSKHSEGDSDDDLVAEIKKLLDGLD